MKIAIITGGRLPVPAIKGGAVETLLDFILAYNAQHHLHDITIYSISPNIHFKNPKTQENHYYFVNTNSILFKIGRRVYSRINPQKVYDSFIEFFLFLSLKHIRKKRYDAIILSNRSGYVEKVANITETPIILFLENDYLNPNMSKAKEIKGHCSGVITCSNYINNQVASVDANHKIPIITVHNGIDIEKFMNAAAIPRERLGLTANDFVIIYSGRIIREKGVLELIQALKMLNDIKNIKLLIVGASFYGKDDVDSPFIQSLKKEVEPIKEKVIFTGYIDYSEMPSYLKVANLAVVPSIWDEPFGLTVLEAMAAGLPLITTYSGGIPEICKGCAILIERKNIVQHISDSIRSLYHNPEYADAFSKKAIERSKEFDKDVFSRTFIKQVEKIIDANNQQ